MRYIIISLFLAILICTLSSIGFSQDLPYSVIVKTEAEEEPQMEAIEEALIAAMPDKEKDIKEALEEFEEVVDETMEEDKSVALYPQYTFEIAKKAFEKGMDRKDVGELLQEYQEAIIEGESATKLRRLIVDGLDKGWEIDRIIKQFEEEEEEEEKEEGE